MGSSQVHWPHKEKALYFKNLSKQAKIEQFFKRLKCSLKAAKVARIEFSLLTDSVLINTSTQKSDREALNYTDTDASQNKSGNTKEVLNNWNITTIEQPAQDLVNNINNYSRENKEDTPEKQGTDFRRSQLGSKACVGDT